MRKVRFPHPVQEGDTVALLALSSPAKADHEVDGARAILESWGLRVRMGRSLRLRRDYLAGTARERAGDLARAVADEQVRALFFLRGGYGAAQAMPLIDLDAIIRRRLFVAGFSDLTILLNALAARGLATLHAPTLASHFVNARASAELESAMRRLMAGVDRSISWTAARAEPLFNRGGAARGPLIGGNLTVFTTMIGTPWLPKPDGAILLLEEVHESPYRVDRMITHLRNAGYLGKLSGIALGDFTDCDGNSMGRWNWREGAAEALREIRVPVLAGIPIGHDSVSLPVWLGAETRIGPRAGVLRQLGTGGSSMTAPGTGGAPGH